MYYKILKNNKAIDVLDSLIYLKWQDKHKIWILCDENEAQAILLSDKNTVVHERTLYNAPVFVDTVDLVEIDEYEYKQLRTLNLSTPEEIIDAFVMSLLDGGVI